MLNKLRMDRGLADDLRRRLKVIGWSLTDWLQWCELPLTAMQLRAILRGEPGREDSVFAVEWCVHRFRKEMDDGTLSVGGKNGLGRTYMRTAHVRAELIGNKLTVTLYGDEEWRRSVGEEVNNGDGGAQNSSSLQETDVGVDVWGQVVQLQDEINQAVKWLYFEPWKYPVKG